MTSSPYFLRTLYRLSNGAIALSANLSVRPVHITVLFAENVFSEWTIIALGLEIVLASTITNTS